MKKQISLRKALAVGVLAAFACSLVTGLTVYHIPAGSWENCMMH